MVFTKVIISAIWFTSHLRKVSRNFSIAHLSYCVEKIRVSKCHNFRILLVKTKGASIVLTTKEDYLKMVFLRLSYYDNDNNVFFFGAISFVTMFAPILNNLNIKLGAISFVIMIATILNNLSVKLAPFF